MTHRIQIAALTVALAALPTLSGCVIDTSGSNQAGTSYAFGHLDGILAGTPKQIVEASEAVLKEQETHIISKDATAFDGKVVARTALDTSIQITVKRQDDSSSRISICVGSFGDPQLSRDLYGKIKAKL
jgi:hypothetical protein